MIGGKARGGEEGKVCDGGGGSSGGDHGGGGGGGRLVGVAGTLSTASQLPPSPHPPS